MDCSGELDAALAWARRLSPDGGLTAEERALLEAVLSEQFDFHRHEVLIEAGTRCHFAVLVLSGFAARVKQLVNGARQIVSILAPGDLCTGGLAFALPVDYALVAMSDGCAARLRVEGLRQLQDSMPRLMLPLGRSLAEEAVIAREWMANMGGRQGPERVAHLLCELVWRLRAVGQVNGSACRLLIGQRDIGEAVGLSRVQVNRVLQRFCKAGLIGLGRGRIEILDEAGLAKVAAFDPHYLEVREAPGRSLAWRGFQLSS
jgi:CRP-like cAMP-binding protein